MRISWNDPISGDWGKVSLTFTSEDGYNMVKEDMTPEMIRNYGNELILAAEGADKRLKRKAALATIENHLRNHEKINAIKELRSLTGMDLLNARDVVELFYKTRW
jgi:ribosomal protein L7/L12